MYSEQHTDGLDYCFDKHMTVHDVARFATRQVHPRVPAERMEEMRQAYAASGDIAAREPTYGRTTGVGANRLTAAATDRRTHGMNIIRSHAVDGGEVVPKEEVRAALAIRLNQLLQGGSGIEPMMIEAVERMLADDALPELHAWGSIGTADLAAMAGVALALVGERPTSRPFEPLAAIGADSALPFLSSSALTLARAALICSDMQRLVAAHCGIFVLSAFAFQANRAAFAPRVATALGSPEAVPVAERLQQLIGDATWDAARIQDPYGFRTFLAGTSVLEMALNRTSDQVTRLVNVAQENPLFDNEAGHVYHHGAFYQIALAHELDALAIALAQTAPLLISRLRFLNDDKLSGLPRFLTPAQDGSSGTMMVEYLAASAMGEVLAASAPVCTHSAVLSCGVEEDATFATTSATKLKRAVQAYEMMLASELLVAVRAIRLRGDAGDCSPQSPIAAMMDCVATLPDSMADHDLRADVGMAQALLPDLARLVQDTVMA